MMQIDNSILARVYSFDLKFKGGKRTQFYRKLTGFESKTVKEDRNGREKVYKNFYPGVLTTIPHLRLGKSVIAIPKTAKDRLDSFFADSKWGSIDLYSFDGIIPSEDRMKAMEDALGRIETTRDEKLNSEIKNLRSILERDELSSEGYERIKRVIRKAEDLKKHDWTDDSEFSRKLDDRIDPLRRVIE